MRKEVQVLSVWAVLGRMLLGAVGCVLMLVVMGEGVYFSWFSGPYPQEVAQTWDRAHAEILDYRMAVRMGYNRVHRGTSADKLEVRYAYVVDGRRYESTEAGWYNHRDIAPFRVPRRAFTDDELPLRRPELGEFDCYVNPQNPAESVLFCNTSSHSRWVAVFVLAVLAFFAAAGAYESYRCARLLRTMRKGWRDR